MAHSEQDAQAKLAAAFAVGAAAEYLARAAIGSHDPVLLAKRGSTPSLVILSRVNSSAPIDLRALRTVDYNALWEILGQINPSLKQLGARQGAASLVATARNAAAHMAMVDDDLMDEATVALVEIVAALHPLLGRTEDQFWGSDLLPLIQSDILDCGAGTPVVRSQ